MSHVTCVCTLIGSGLLPGEAPVLLAATSQTFLFPVF